jgi:hypothetical protein
MDDEIQQLFKTNKVDDLKRFMRKRQCLNSYNCVFMYAFHVVQAAGILTTTIAAGYDIKELVWVGASMNVIATLIQVFEKTNESVSKTMMKNIEDIRNGTYVDEGMIMPDDDKKTPLLNKTEQEATNNV